MFDCMNFYVSYLILAVQSWNLCYLPLISLERILQVLSREQRAYTGLIVPCMFLSKTQIWEDRSNRLNDVDSRPDALIHKASCAFKIQTSGRQPSWSGHGSYLYGNCMHIINRPDDHSLGLDEQSLDIEIACS